MTTQERKEALDRVVSNPILNGANVQFNLRKPFGILIEMKQKENWCTRQDSNLEPSDPKSDTLSIELRVHKRLESKFISDQQELQVQKPLLAPHLSDSRSLSL